MSNIAQNFAFLSKALDMRTQRHQVLASNIANADTPNYKARDFDFQSAMQNAMGARSGASAAGMTVTSAGHLKGNGMAYPAALQFRKETQSAADGNTVDMDVERAQITDNALQYQIVAQLISDRFKGMRTALSNTQS